MTMEEIDTVTVVADTADVTEVDLIKELAKAEETQRSRQRPDISAMEDAVVKNELGELELNARPGDRIIIERWVPFNSNRVWLDTQVYRIVAVDRDTGDLDLFNEELRQQALSNYITAVKPPYNYQIKLPDGSPLGRKRQRKAKTKAMQDIFDRQDEANTPTKVTDRVPQQAQPSLVKGSVAPDTSKPKRKGRPKGSKNRPKEVILAEKAARAKEQSDRRAARVKRRKGRVKI